MAVDHNSNGSEIYERFKETAYGQSLVGKPRWDRYRPEHIETSEWIELLSSDADNLEHMRITLAVTDIFIKNDDGSLGISDEESELLHLAAAVHDWGESYDPVTGKGGDINFEVKTTDDIQAEITRFYTVFDEIIGEDEVKLKHILASIIFNDTTKLGHIFNAIERVGYMRTARVAMRKSLTTPDPVLRDHLQWLTAGVLSNQIIPLMQDAGNFTPVRKYLEVIAPSINEAYSYIDEDVFLRHNQLQKDRRNAFRQSKTAWDRDSIHTIEVKNTETKGVFSQNANYESRFVQSYEELTKKVEAFRILGFSIVLTSGSFDLLHIGHMKYLEKAKQHGDILIVGVDSDTKIQQRKGPNRPMVEQDERTRMLSHIRDVDLITLKTPHDKKWELIKLVAPDVLIATSETYTPEEITELEAQYCKKVVVLEPQATTSTSARIRKINIDGLKSFVRPILNTIEDGASVDDIRKLIDDVLNES